MLIKIYDLSLAINWSISSGFGAVYAFFRLLVIWGPILVQNRNERS